MGCASSIVAMTRMLTHLPWPEQSFGQDAARREGGGAPDSAAAAMGADAAAAAACALRWQASPAKPGKQMHCPVARSHEPALEHSARA